jgi:hypothetical protein
MHKKQVKQPCCNECAGGILYDIFVKPFVPKKKTKIEKLSPEVSLYSEMCIESYKKNKSKLVIGPFTKDNSFSEENCIVYVSDDSTVLAIRGTDPKNSKDIFTDILLALNKLKITPRYRQINDIFNLRMHGKYPTGRGYNKKLFLEISNIEKKILLLQNIHSRNDHHCYKCLL